MKKLIVNCIVILLVELSNHQLVKAQGSMTFLSNLWQTPEGSFAVGSNSWYAALFFTGTDAGGYLLDSIQLQMANATGDPSAFTVMLYGLNSNNVSGAFPGNSIGTLTGTLNPVAGGIYTFTTISNLMLSSFTPYYIVLTAGTAVANGAYDWSYVSTYSYSRVGNWFTFGNVFNSSDGLSWNSAPSTDTPKNNLQFAINATAIPEPGVLGLLSLVGLGFLWHRRKRVGI